MGYEKIADCPEGLEQIIKLVNSLPKNIGAIYKRLKSDFDREKMELRKEAQIDRDAQLALIFLDNKYEKQIKEVLPENVYLYVIGIFDQDFDESVSYYASHLLIPLEKLRELLRLKNLLRKMAIATFREFEVLHPMASLSFRPVVNFGLDKNGNLKPLSNPLVEVFSKNDIQLERLRICPMCDEIFFAKRFEAPTCLNKKCSNKFHQRKLRVEEYEKRLAEAYEVYNKLESDPESATSQVEKQKHLISKIQEKIKRNKIK